MMWVQQRFFSLFINIVAFIRTNPSRFKLVSNPCWPLCSAFVRDLLSLWKGAILSSSLLPVAGNSEGVGERGALQPCSSFSL